MKIKLNSFQRSSLLLFALALLLSFSACNQPEEKAESATSAQTEAATATPAPRESVSENNSIQWMSIEEALAAQKGNPKPIFIDVYTDWCRWCKVMDDKTFSQPKVAQYMNENFHSVKFNAEKEKPLVLNGQQFEVVQAGRRGVHTFAYALLNGQLSYPSYVVLDSELQRQAILKGFKEADPFLEELKGIR